MTMTQTDPREVYARALAQSANHVAAVRPDQLHLPTPCSEWDVRVLLSHMVGGVTRTAILGEGGDALSVAPFAAGVPDDGWPAAYDAAGQRAMAAWAEDARLDALVTVPWGTVPGRVAIAGYVREVLAHGWDLATATGQPAEQDPDLGAFALEISQRSLPAEGREHIPFGPVVEVAPTAGVYARLAAWLGRTP